MTSYVTTTVTQRRSYVTTTVTQRRTPLVLYAAGVIVAGIVCRCVTGVHRCAIAAVYRCVSLLMWCAGVSFTGEHIPVIVTGVVCSCVIIVAGVHMYDCWHA